MDDIDHKDYKIVKNENEGKINVLEAKASDLNGNKISIQQLENTIDSALSTVTKIDLIYCKSNS